MVQSFYVWRIYNLTKNIWVSLIIEVVSTWMRSLIPGLNSFSRLLLSNVFSLGTTAYLYELPFICAAALAQYGQVTVQGFDLEKLRLAVSSRVSVRIYVSPNFDSGLFLTWLQVWLAGSAACDVMITSAIVFVVCDLIDSYCISCYWSRWLAVSCTFAVRIQSDNECCHKNHPFHSRDRPAYFYRCCYRVDSVVNSIRVQCTFHWVSSLPYLHCE